MAAGRTQENFRSQKAISAERQIGRRRRREGRVLSVGGGERHNGDHAAIGRGIKQRFPLNTYFISLLSLSQLPAVQGINSLI
jgi:hypothetical protein